MLCWKFFRPITLVRAPMFLVTIMILFVPVIQSFCTYSITIYAVTEILNKIIIAPSDVSILLFFRKNNNSGCLHNNNLTATFTIRTITLPCSHNNYNFRIHMQEWVRAFAPLVEVWVFKSQPRHT